MKIKYNNLEIKKYTPEDNLEVEVYVTEINIEEEAEDEEDN